MISSSRCVKRSDKTKPRAPTDRKETIAVSTGVVLTASKQTSVSHADDNEERRLIGR